MSPIKLGFVGLSKEGWAATSLVPAIRQPGVAEHYTISAVSTTSATSAASSAEKWTKDEGHDVKAYHGDTKHIAADTNVDLVAVSVKVMLHKAALVPAIEAGKDVFVEWPLANGLDETIELTRLAQSKGVRTMVGLQGWASPQARKVSKRMRMLCCGESLMSRPSGQRNSCSGDHRPCGIYHSSEYHTLIRLRPTSSYISTSVRC